MRLPALASCGPCSGAQSSGPCPRPCLPAWAAFPGIVEEPARHPNFTELPMLRNHQCSKLSQRISRGALQRVLCGGEAVGRDRRARAVTAQNSLGAASVEAKRQNASPLIGMSASLAASMGMVGAMPICRWAKEGDSGLQWGAIERAARTCQLAKWGTHVLSFSTKGIPCGTAQHGRPPGIGCTEANATRGRQA